MRQNFAIEGLGQIVVEISALNLADVNRIAEAVMAPHVKTSADLLVSRLRPNAPSRTGALSRGIMVSPAPERSSDPAKVVYDIYFDPAMNETFVKKTKDGKRYYYPASQEYGFKTANGKRVPGRYYMRNTAVEFYGTHRDRMADGVNDILEEL